MRIQLNVLSLLYAILITAVICWPLRAVAQQPAESAPAQAAAKDVELSDENYILRTYEVGDLILDVQDHTPSETIPGATIFRGGGGGGFGGGGFGGGGGGGFFSVPNEAASSGEFGREQMGAAARFAVANEEARLQLCQLAGDGGRFGGGAGGVAPGGMAVGTPTPGGASVTMDDLRRVLTNTIASDSWAINGTGEGKIEPIGTALVVWQTRAVHRQIGELLEQVRSGSAGRRTVTIDARWLLLNSDELESLLLPDQKGVPEVDRKRLAQFTRRPGSIRGITSCFSSQLVYLVSGTRRNVVSGYIPVVGSLEPPDQGERLASSRPESLVRFVADTTFERGSAVGYQPMVVVPNFGALLQIRPTLTPGDNTAVVDLKSTLTVPGEEIAATAEINASAVIAPQVDRIPIETQEFATTLRVPLGKPVLVGGLTYVPASMAAGEPNGEVPADQAKGATTENPQLYFVLEVR